MIGRPSSNYCQNNATNIYGCTVGVIFELAAGGPNPPIKVTAKLYGTDRGYCAPSLPDYTNLSSREPNLTYAR
jgi:hypothetical protein